MTNPGDCTAIIMAAGAGSRMTDLSNQCPKPLLPVGPFPMIWYPIRMLEKAGFSEIMVVTKQSWLDQIHTSLSDSSSHLRAHLEMVEVPDLDDWGTADSLRHVADRIKTTALVVSCDVISDCELSELMSVHRKYDSSLTAMLSELPITVLADTPVPGFKSKQKNATAERISIGFESCNTDHIVFWKAQIDMDDEFLSFSKKFLDRFPCTRIQSTWTDCHVYMIDKFVIKYLQDRKDLSTISSELVPQVVKKQMSTYICDKPREDTDMSSPGEDLKDKKKDLVDYAAERKSNLACMVKNLSLTSSSFGSSDDAPQKDLIRCYSYQQTRGYCVRANTVGAYFEACKQIPRLLTHFLSTAKKKVVMSNVPESTTIKPKSQVGADSMLGESVTIGEKVSIKKSVIGKHCKIGDKVKITNSVIMDHVNIQESSNITNCIIADSANIGDKCELSSCIVGQNQNISTMSKHTNEVLSNVSQMMEVTLE